MTSCLTRRAKKVERKWEPHALVADPCVLARLVESIACSEEVCVLTRWMEAEKEFESEPDWALWPQRFYEEGSEVQLPAE